MGLKHVNINIILGDPTAVDSDGEEEECDLSEESSCESSEEDSEGILIRFQYYD